MTSWFSLDHLRRSTSPHSGPHPASFPGGGLGGSYYTRPHSPLPEFGRIPAQPQSTPRSPISRQPINTEIQPLSINLVSRHGCLQGTYLYSLNPLNSPPSLLDLFPVEEIINPTLPPNMKIHTTFHVSQLKPVSSSPLSSCFVLAIKAF